MSRVAAAGLVTIGLRIVIKDPVVGVVYSLQAKDGSPLSPRRSLGGEPLSFDLVIRVAPGPRFLGEQVRREGPAGRFVYIRVGQYAGDTASPWFRRMKIDIRDVAGDLVDVAAKSACMIETTVIGTGRDGTPAWATVLPVRRRLLDQ